MSQSIKNRTSTSRLFALTAITFVVVAIGLRMFSSYSSIDIQLHDTYITMGPSDPLILFGIILGLFSFLYYILPKIIGKELSQFLGRLHFYVTIIGIVLIISFTIKESATVLSESDQDRYLKILKLRFDSKTLKVIMSTVILQLIFVANVIYSLVRKEGG